MNTLRTPRVGLNAHLLNLSGNYRSAGINWYIYHLLRNLSSSEFDFTVFLSESRAAEHFDHLRLIRSHLPTHQPIARILWEQFVQPFALRRERIDLYHALAFAGPVAISTPWVVTIYDLSFALYPQSFKTANRIYLTWAVRDAVRRADRIIAISASTQRDLVRIFGVAPDKIAVVYCGLNPAFAPAPREQVEAFRAQRGLPDRFILHVGTLEPRKNIARLIHAFADAKRRAHLPHRLILVGARGWKYADVDAAIAEENVADDVILAGYVPQDELPCWYRAADLFAYPSLYEGFGLPPLDAMACGTPVITSDASSLPEVVGDAGLVIAPDDTDGLADAIARVLSDRTLCEQMSARGLEQAAKFSWARAARETINVYRSIMGATHASA